MMRGKSLLVKRAWWVAPGPEICGFCFAAYHMEIARYCDGCGRPVCPACRVVVSERRTVLCPECAAEEES